MRRKDFDRLIKKNEVDAVLIWKEKGSYVDGEYVAGLEERNAIKAVITPISERKVFASGGSYTTEDMQIVSRKEIDLDGEPQVEQNGKRYKLEPDANYKNYVDVFHYIMKRVDNFDKSKTDDSCLDRRIT